MFLRAAGITLATLCLAAATLAAVAVWTPGGSSLVIRQLLPRALRAERVVIRDITGTLWDGLSLHGVLVHHPKKMPEGTFLIERVDAAPLSTLLRQRISAVTAHEVRARVPALRSALHVRRLQYVLGRLVISDLELQDPPGLPPGSWMRVQEVEVEQPLLRSRRLVRLHNGRLLLPYSGMILVHALPTAAGEPIRLRAHAETLDVHELLGLLPLRRGPGTMTGRLRDVTLQAEGAWPQATLNALFHVERLTRRGISLVDAPGSLRLEVARKETLTVRGQVALQRGVIHAPPSAIRLEPSTIRFEGDPAQPIYDMRAVASVEGTTIRMTLTGTRQAPQLALRSVPDMPQERLLIMLATGKSWQGVHRLSQGRLSPDLVKDVVDTLLLGGRGSAWAHRVGISDMELLYDEQTKQMGIRTIFFDKFGARYQVEPAVDTEAEEAVGLESGATHTVGAEYKLNEQSSIHLEGEKEQLPARATTPVGGPLSPENGLVDKLLLKYKRQF